MDDRELLTDREDIFEMLTRLGIFTRSRDRRHELAATLAAHGGIAERHIDMLLLQFKREGFREPVAGLVKQLRDNSWKEIIEDLEAANEKRITRQNNQMDLAVRHRSRDQWSDEERREVAREVAKEFCPRQCMDGFSGLQRFAEYMEMNEGDAKALLKEIGTGLRYPNPPKKRLWK